MVGGPAAADAVARARRLPDLRVGLHLVLVDGHPTGARHGVSRGEAADHKTRGRQNAAPVRFLDSFVDGGVEPEIVGADDQASQLAISRLRRN